MHRVAKVGLAVCLLSTVWGQIIQNISISQAGCSSTYGYSERPFLRAQTWSPDDVPRNGTRKVAVWSTVRESRGDFRVSETDHRLVEVPATGIYALFFRINVSAASERETFFGLHVVGRDERARALYALPSTFFGPASGVTLQSLEKNDKLLILMDPTIQLSFNPSEPAVEFVGFLISKKK